MCFIWEAERLPARNTVWGGGEEVEEDLVAYSRVWGGQEAVCCRLIARPQSQEPPWEIRTLISSASPQWGTLFP